MPDLRLIGDDEWEAARAEIFRRMRDNGSTAAAGKPRAKHLLSGLIKCSICDSNYTISGKDYYRCAGEKERGNCGNKVSVRKDPIETATLSALEKDLLTEEYAKLFVKEFQLEAAHLTDRTTDRTSDARKRLSELEIELGNLTENLLAGLASPTLMAMTTEQRQRR